MSLEDVALVEEMIDKGQIKMAISQKRDGKEIKTAFWYNDSRKILNYDEVNSSSKIKEYLMND